MFTFCSYGNEAEGHILLKVHRGYKGKCVGGGVMERVKGTEFFSDHINNNKVTLKETGLYFIQ